MNNSGLIFVSTDLRLENSSSVLTDLKEISNNENQAECIEVFTHEWRLDNEIKMKLWLTGFFFWKEGYSWDYPMYRYGQDISKSN